MHPGIGLLRLVSFEYIVRSCNLWQPCAFPFRSSPNVFLGISLAVGVNDSRAGPKTRSTWSRRSPECYTSGLIVGMSDTVTIVDRLRFRKAYARELRQYNLQDDSPTFQLDHLQI